MEPETTGTTTILPQAAIEPGRLYSIGQVASLFNVTLRTIRLYCDRKLISERSRTSRRYFDAYNVQRLSLVIQGRLLGLTLREIDGLINDCVNEFGTPTLVVPERLIKQKVDALRERNEAVLEIITQGILQDVEDIPISDNIHKSSLSFIS